MTPEKAAQLYEEFDGQGIYPGDEDILDALLTLSRARVEEWHVKSHSPSSRERTIRRLIISEEITHD